MPDRRAPSGSSMPYMAIWVPNRPTTATNRIKPADEENAERESLVSQSIGYMRKRTSVTIAMGIIHTESRRSRIARGIARTLIVRHCGITG